MRYADMRDMQYERAGLLAKKRLGSRQKARLAQLSEQLEHTTQPPATPPTPNTGQRGDFQGDVYALHAGKAPRLREMRRDRRFHIRPMRSRIQRTKRRRRTGGVK